MLFFKSFSPNPIRFLVFIFFLFVRISGEDANRFIKIDPLFVEWTRKIPTESAIVDWSKKIPPEPLQCRLKELMNWFDDNGFPLARCRLVPLSADTLLLEGSSGPRIQIRGLQIEGVQCQLIQRIFAQMIHRDYHSSMILKRLQVLNRYSFIDSLELAAVLIHDNRHQADLLLKGIERNSLKFEGMAYYSDATWLGRLDFHEANLLNQGLDFNFQYQKISPLYSKMNASVAYPYLKGLPVDMRFEFHQLKESQKFQQFLFSVDLSWILGNGVWQLGATLEKRVFYPLSHQGGIVPGSDDFSWGGYLRQVMPALVWPAWPWSIQYGWRVSQKIHHWRCQGEQLISINQHFIAKIGGEVEGFSPPGRAIPIYDQILVGGDDRLAAYPSSLIWARQLAGIRAALQWGLPPATHLHLYFEWYGIVNNLNLPSQLKDWGVHWSIPLSHNTQWAALIVAFPANLKWREGMLYFKFISL